MNSLFVKEEIILNADKKLIIKKLIWDYDISIEDILLCLEGKKEKAGFYNKTDLVIKMLNHLSWYKIIALIDLDELKNYLTKENIKRIFPKGLRIKYEFLRKLLFKEAIPAAGWNSKNDEFPIYALLSNSG